MGRTGDILQELFILRENEWVCIKAYLSHIENDEDVSELQSKCLSI